MEELFSMTTGFSGKVKKAEIPEPGDLHGTFS